MASERVTALQRQEPDPRAKAIEAMARAIESDLRGLGDPTGQRYETAPILSNPATAEHAAKRAARAALAALEQEGLVLTDTREVQRLREAHTIFDDACPACRKHGFGCALASVPVEKAESDG